MNDEKDLQALRTLQQFANECYGKGVRDASAVIFVGSVITFAVSMAYLKYKDRKENTTLEDKAK